MAVRTLVVSIMTATTMATPPPRDKAASTARSVCRRIARRLTIRRTLRVAVNDRRAMLHRYVPESDRDQLRCDRREGKRVVELHRRSIDHGLPGRSFDL